MLKLVLGAIFTLLVAGGGPLVWYYDRGAFDHLSYTAHILFWSHTFRLPESIAGKAAAEAHDFTTEQSSFHTLQSAFTVENRAVLSLAETGDDMQARSAAAVRHATQANAWRLRLADQIINAPTPTDTSAAGQCKAAEAVLREGGQ